MLWLHTAAPQVWGASKQGILTLSGRLETIYWPDWALGEF
jgi:hypothetical protein